MQIISMITDFGLKDNFVGVMKAVILKINPKAQIVDICHEIKPQDILGAAFLLKSAFKYFPKNTVHLVVVDPGVGSQRKKIIVRTKNYYFVGPDNGVLSLSLKDEPPVEIMEISNQKYFLKPISDTFHGRDIFAPISAYILKGKDIRKFGKRIKSIQRLNLSRVKMTSKSLSGEIIYIDRFGNLVTNIDKDIFSRVTKNKKFKISIKDKVIYRLSQSYTEGGPLKPLALIDSFNYLEIALNGGSASDYLKAEPGTPVTVTTSQI